MKHLTVPSDSSNLQQPPIQSDLWSRKISWEFDCKLSQAEYLEWVSERLKGKFKTARSSRDEAVFTKNLDGDTETVVIRTRTDGENVHVRVEVSVLPD